MAEISFAGGQGILDSADQDTSSSGFPSSRRFTDRMLVSLEQRKVERVRLVQAAVSDGSYDYDAWLSPAIDRMIDDAATLAS